MAEYSAVRKRRVRLFELLATLLVVAIAIISALTWSDFAASPGISPQYVSYPSTDGVTISGALFLPAGTGPFPGVVVVHGLTDHKEYLNRVSVELARRGIAALAIDLRDHGMSDGACTFGLPTGEVQDVVNGISFLRARPEVDGSRLGMMGHSFGGMVALTASALSPALVNATVTWAAPINLTSLSRDAFATVSFAADKRVLPANLQEPEQLALRSPITYLATLRPNSTLFLHSEDDELVPVSQVEEARNATQGQDQTVQVVAGAPHAMRTDQVMGATLGFLLDKLGVPPPQDDPFPAYVSFEKDAAWLDLALAVFAWPVAWLSWEFTCTRRPQLVKQYTFPADKRRSRAALFLAADLAAFGAIAVAVGAVVVPGSAAAPFAGVLPAPSLFAALLLGGSALLGAAIVLARVERRVRGRDDQAFEEGESQGRSIRALIPVLLLVPFAAALQYLLFLGTNQPRSAGFLLPVIVLAVLTFGLEAFVRLRVQRRLRGLLGALFAKRPLAQAVLSILVGTLLFFVAVTWVVTWLFKGYAQVPYHALLFTLAVGVVSSIFYDRTKSIVPGALFSAVYLAWALNGPFHF